MAEFVHEGRRPPGGSCILDYLRATILCPSVEACISALTKIAGAFDVIRVKDRLLDEATTGNQVLLINMIVSNPDLHPRTCSMFTPGWWEGRTVEMICEIQIAVREMYYLDKQFHVAYEIERCNTPEEWTSSLEADPTYQVSERSKFPLGLLYGTSDFAF